MVSLYHDFYHLAHRLIILIKGNYTMHNYTLSGTRIYSTVHKMNGYIMEMWREYEFQVIQVRILLDNGKISDIFQSEYVFTPNE